MSVRMLRFIERYIELFSSKEVTVHALGLYARRRFDIFKGALGFSENP